MVVIYKLIRRRSVHKLEIFGTILAIIGSIILMYDKDAQKVDSEH
jgi:TRAP-type mannitol/chloroaromatic compound transport system permease small subunit